MMKKLLSILILLTGLWAQETTKHFTHSGYLMQNGIPITDNERKMEVKLFDAISGGNELWSSGQVERRVVNGVYSIVLGVENPSQFEAIDWTAGDKFIEVSYDKEDGSGFQTLGPRTHVMAVPVALKSGDAAKFEGRTPDQLKEEIRTGTKVVNAERADNVSWATTENGNSRVRFSHSDRDVRFIVSSETERPEIWIETGDSDGNSPRLNFNDAGSLWVFDAPRNFNLLLSSSRGAFGQFNLTSGAYSHSSDERLKENNEDIDSALEILEQIQGITFNFKSTNEGEKPLESGVTAQNLKEVLPHLVSENPENGFMVVSYSGLIPYLIEAVKELKAENEMMKTEIEGLKNQ